MNPDGIAIDSDTYCKLLVLADEYASRILSIESDHRFYLEGINDRYRADMESAARAFDKCVGPDTTDQARADYQLARDRAEHAARVARDVKTCMLTNHVDRLTNAVYREIDATEL